MKKLISETFYLFIKNINSLVLIYFPFLLLSSMVGYFQKNSEGIFYYYLYIIVQLLIESFFTPMLIIFLSLVLYDRTWNFKDIFLRGLAFVPNIFIISLVLFFPAATFPYITQYLGLFGGMLFAVIWIFIGLKLSFSTYLIVLENNKLFDAIKKSFLYTNNYIGRILLILIVFGIPLGIIQLTVDFFNENSIPFYAIQILTDQFLVGIISLLLPIAIFKIYCIDYFQRVESIN